MKSTRLAASGTERGFTLVEILVALVILLIVVTACFPLFSLATKTTHENRMRMTASELAKQEIEDILSRVTAANYTSEDADAPLRTTDISQFEDVPGYPGYQIKKSVEWVDDPDDGVYPDDRIPFDYKELTVEVSYPSHFGNSVSHKTDFKTFLAREGTASPTTGLVVEVNELLDAIPTTEKISGAEVTITNLDTGDEDSATTNEDGFAFFKVDVPENVPEYTYEVSVEAFGLMMDPAPADLNRVIVTSDATSVITIAMAEPGTISVRFRSPAAQGYIEVVGGSYSLLVDVNKIGSGGSQISKTFENLWPFSAYQVNAHFPIHHIDLIDADVRARFEESPADDEATNLWQYSENETGWIARPGDYGSDGGLASYHRLIYRINLNDYRPADTSVQVTQAILSPATAFDLEMGSEDQTFAVIKMNKSSNIPNIDNDDDWISLANLGDLDSLIAGTDPGNQGFIQLPNPDTVLSNNFVLRFDSTPDITSFVFHDLFIACQYRGNVTFESPGENCTVDLTQ